MGSDSQSGSEKSNKETPNHSKEEYEDNSQIIDTEDIVLNHYDLGQEMKGNRLEWIGRKQALGRDEQDELDKRRYGILTESEDDQDQPTVTANFYDMQDKEFHERQRQAPDKHLLPKDDFYECLPREEIDRKKKRNEKPLPIEKLPYGQIDVIFNHKNIWGNLQNEDPVHIKYELHNEAQWLPFVRDDTFPHPREDEKYRPFKRWLDKQKKIIDEIKDGENGEKNKFFKLKQKMQKGQDDIPVDESNQEFQIAFSKIRNISQ